MINLNHMKRLNYQISNEYKRNFYSLMSQSMKKYVKSIIDKVMDGDINNFLFAYLKSQI